VIKIFIYFSTESNKFYKKIHIVSNRIWHQRKRMHSILSMYGTQGKLMHNKYSQSTVLLTFGNRNKLLQHTGIEVFCEGHFAIYWANAWCTIQVKLITEMSIITPSKL